MDITELPYNLEQSIIQNIQWGVARLTTPHVVMRPSIFPDGTKWCCLLGDDLMTGISGFGDTPQQAAEAFDLAWTQGRTPDAMLRAKE